MQRLEPMNDPHSGSKIEILKNILKYILQITYSSSVKKKNHSKKKKIVEK